MIPAFLIDRFGRTGAKAIFFGSIIGIVGVILLLSYCSGRSDGKQSEVNSQLNRENKTLVKVNDANENASVTRIEDSNKLQNEQKEIEDAVANSHGPNDERAMRGCVILRQQGRDTSGIPACNRP